MADDHADLGSEPAQPLVVAGLLGDVREQVAEPSAGEAQEAPLGVTLQNDLRDRQSDELCIADPWASPCTAALRQEIVRHHVKCCEQALEVGVHEATSVVDVAETTPTFDSRCMAPRVAAMPGANSESVI